MCTQRVRSRLRDQRVRQLCLQRVVSQLCVLQSGRQPLHLCLGTLQQAIAVRRVCLQANDVCSQGRDLPTVFLPLLLQSGFGD
jgi:hypothetical protein